jgi:hypothetical protein
MFSPNKLGWGSNKFSLNGGAIVTPTAPSSGFYSSSSLCLKDGCYPLTVGGDNSSQYSSGFWDVCGYMGLLPWAAQLCIDSSYGLCYGLTGCPVLKSFAHTRDENWYAVVDSEGVMQDVGNPHSVHELCMLDEGCYDVLLGAGLSADAGSFSSVDLCGTPLTLASRATMCVSGTPISYGAYGQQQTNCTVVPYTSTSCAGNPVGPALRSIFMVSESGVGWGNIKYTITSNTSLAILYTNGLIRGEIGMDDNCFTVGRCYSISMSSGINAADVLFIMCGIVGGAPLTSSVFCVTEFGCEFQVSKATANDDAYGGGSSTYGGGSSAYGSDSGNTDDTPDLHPNDDDFPVSDMNPVTQSPSQPSDSKPTRSHMPSRQGPSKQPSASPTALPPNVVQVVETIANLTIALSSTRPIVTLTKTDVAFAAFAFRRVMDLAGIDVWDAVAEYDFFANTKLLSITTERDEHLHAEYQRNLATRSQSEDLEHELYYYNSVVSFPVYMTLVVGPSGGVESTVETERHTLALALNTGLLQGVLIEAFNFQIRSGPPGTPSAPASSLAHMDLVSATLIDNEYLLNVMTASTRPLVSSDYSKIFSHGTTYVKQELPAWVIALMSCVATVVFVSCCYCINWCVISRKSNRYARIKLADQLAEDEENISEMSSPPPAGGSISSGIMRGTQRPGSRKSFESDTLSIVFNQPMNEIRPQA